MLYTGVMYVEGAGCWLFRMGTSPRTWSLKLLMEAIWSTHVSLCHALVSLALVGGCAMLGSW